MKSASTTLLIAFTASCCCLADSAKFTAVKSLYYEPGDDNCEKPSVSFKVELDGVMGLCLPNPFGDGSMIFEIGEEEGVKKKKTKVYTRKDCQGGSDEYFTEISLLNECYRGLKRVVEEVDFEGFTLFTTSNLDTFPSKTPCNGFKAAKVLTDFMDATYLRSDLYRTNQCQSFRSKMVELNAAEQTFKVFDNSTLCSGSLTSDSTNCFTDSTLNAVILTGSFNDIVSARLQALEDMRKTSVPTRAPTNSSSGGETTDQPSEAASVSVAFGLSSIIFLAVYK